jgi:hypothetical protein
VEIVSGEVVTEASVVRNAIPFVAGVGAAADGAATGAEATTDSSVVGKSGATLASGGGEATAVSAAGRVVGPAFIFVSVSCCAFTCCWSA